MDKEVVLVLIRGLRSMANELEALIQEEEENSERGDTAKQLKQLGFSANLIGFTYLVEAIELQKGNPPLKYMDICDEIGKMCLVSSRQVRSAIGALFFNLSEESRKLIVEKYQADSPRAFIRSFANNA